MSARSNMTMRATVTRNYNTGTDTGGHPVAPTFIEVGVIPCRAWSKMKRAVDNVGKSVVIEDMRASVTADADVQEKDRLVIKDRLGLTVFGGPVAVETRQRAGGSGSAASHYELMLTRHF